MASYCIGYFLWWNYYSVHYSEISYPVFVEKLSLKFWKF